jgi:hypothetical protein
MVPSSTITVAAGGECLSRDGVSLGKTIHFGSLEFIDDCFSGLRFSICRDGLDATTVGSTHGEPQSPLQAMTGDSIGEFLKASDGEGGLNLLSPRTRGTGASFTPATTMSWLENTPTTQAMTTIPPRPAAGHRPPC